MYSPGLLGFSPGLCLSAIIFLRRSMIAELRTGCGPETFDGRGGRGGFGTGGAGGLGRPGGAGGFGPGLPGGRIGSGLPGGILLIITLALATRPPYWRTLPVETYLLCQAESAALPSLASVSSCRPCSEPSRNFPFWGLCRPLRRVPRFSSHAIICSQSCTGRRTQICIDCGSVGTISLDAIMNRRHVNRVKFKN